MCSSTRQAIACIVLTLATASYVRPHQGAPQKIPSASISGTVKLKGKGVAGIVVIATTMRARSWETERYRAVTDQLGNYSITKLPAGNYTIAVLRRAFVVEAERAAKSLLISEGENVENMDFVLGRGGVITGRVTDSEGEPLIEESVGLLSTDNSTIYTLSVQTDDRGVYRFFGVPPGKYKVHAGRSDRDGPMSSSATLYKQTFHPSFTVEAKAPAIEVTEGSESSNVDIVLGKPVTGFTVKGRVVDGESGKPVANANLGLMQFSEYGGRSTEGGQTTDAAGEFKLQNLLPGKYSVYVAPGNSNQQRASTAFEVIDRDLTDLLIKTRKGASVSGVVVLESSEQGVDPTRNGELLVFLQYERQMRNVYNNTTLRVERDGTFKGGGFPSGLARFEIFQFMRKTGSQLSIVRVERNGVAQPQGIELKEGEEVAGLRLVVRESNGKISGVVKVENGAPVFTFAQLSVVRLDDDLSKGTAVAYGSDQIDARGHFLIEGLAAGNYEVSVTALLAGGRAQLQTKQQVVVTNNSTSEVTLTLVSKPNPDQF